MIVGTIIPHDADTTHRQQRGERLPDVVVKPRAPDLLDEDVVRAAQNIELLARDLARAADSEPRTGKRVPADESFRQAELTAQRAHLVLEQLAQWLDELHVHARGPPAHIVVRLDGDRRSAAEGHALDHIGIERALREKFCAPELARFLLEHVDEELADGLSLLLGIGDAGKCVEKDASRFDMHQRNIVAVAKERYDLFALAKPQ